MNQEVPVQNNPLKLYMIKRTDEIDYGEVIAIVVAAPDEATALSIHPNPKLGEPFLNWDDKPWGYDCTKADLKITQIGVANSDAVIGVILCSESGS